MPLNGFERVRPILQSWHCAYHQIVRPCMETHQHTLVLPTAHDEGPEGPIAGEYAMPQ